MATRKPKVPTVSAAALSKVMAVLGHRGGSARAKNLTPAQLSAIGRLGAASSPRSQPTQGAAGKLRARGQRRGLPTTNENHEQE